MFSVLISWIITTFLFFTFGDILITIWNMAIKKENSFSVFDTFWLGMCAVGISLMITSLVSPICIYINILLVVAAVGYWLFNIKRASRLWQEIKGKILNLAWYVKIILVLLAIILIACNLKNLTTYDSGLYYYQTLMWNEQYSVVPGLGNLHSRLGFNSNFLLLSTLYYHPAHFITFFPLNTLFVFFVTSWMVIRLFKEKKVVFQLVLFLAIYLIIKAYFDMLSSLSTDIGPNSIIIYILLSCILNPKSLKERVLPLCMLAVFSITFKLSLLLICVIPFIILYILIKEKKYKELSVIVVFMALIVIPWCTRFVILTGYLVYPFPALDIFSFDWKMPYKLAELEKTIIYAFANNPFVSIDESLNNTPLDTKWFQAHISWMHTSTKFAYALILFSPILILCFLKKWKSNWMILIAWGVSFLGVLMNFFTGPDPRFSQGFVIMAALTPLLYIPFGRWNPKIITFGWCVVFAMLFLLYTKLVKEFVIDPKSEYSSLHTFIYKPEPFLNDVKKEDMVFYEYLIDDVVVYSTNPIGEDPEICYLNCNNRCYDQTLPCTPYLNVGLELRGKSLQEGFRIRKE